MSTETIIRWLGGLAAWATLVVVMLGIWQGAGRPPGATSGSKPGWLRSAGFYAFALTAFLVISWWGWKTLPISLAPPYRLFTLVLGCLLYFPGLGLVLWGRLTLGRMYFVSTSMGAQLFADHKLIRSGPFAWVRHPMYAGLIVAALGSLLIYQTWTALAYLLFSPSVLLRARREERVLAQEFGEPWREYCENVPAFIPRWKRRAGDRAAHKPAG